MPAPGNSAGTYGWVSVTLHWLVAVLFLGEIPLGCMRCSPTRLASWLASTRRPRCAIT